MISRRDFIRVSLAAGGLAIVPRAHAARRILSGGPASTRGPLLLLQGNTAIDRDIAKGVLSALGEAGLGQVRSIEIPQYSTSRLLGLVAWLDTVRGGTAICTLRVRNCFLFDEALMEKRARILYRGAHIAADDGDGPVRHHVLELPASAGVGALLADGNAGVEQLGASLAMVATRLWTPALAHAQQESSSAADSATAWPSVVTYVIEL